jgi:calcium-dependent protein kinase
MPVETALKHGATGLEASASSKRPSSGLLSKLLQPLGAAVGRGGLARQQQPRGAGSGVACRAQAEAASHAGQAGSASGIAPGASAAADLSFMDLGYPRNLEENYLIWREIGRGGNGVVKLVSDRKTGQQYGEPPRR